jgi:hypothetical protein
LVEYKTFDYYLLAQLGQSFLVGIVQSFPTSIRSDSLISGSSLDRLWPKLISRLCHSVFSVCRTCHGTATEEAVGSSPVGAAADPTHHHPSYLRVGEVVDRLCGRY